MVLKTPIEKLTFIYDADSGIWDAMVDSAKKVLRINGCALCEITHGLVSEKSEWRACHRALGVPIDYLHRDEIPEELAPLVTGKLPCIVAAPKGQPPVVLLDAQAIARCRGSVEDLRGKILFWAARNDLSL